MSVLLLDAKAPTPIPYVGVGRLFPAPASTPSVMASLSYAAASTNRAVCHMYTLPDGRAPEDCEFEECHTKITDMRYAEVPPVIEREGFALWDAPSTVKDFADHSAIERIYYGEMAELALLATGANQAIVFDHVIRKRESGRPALGLGRHGDGSRPGANGRVHNDYSEHSGQRRLGLVMEKLGRRLPAQRYAIVNIWRSIGGPIMDTPLALCDGRTVSTLDLISTELRFPDRVGEIYLLRHSPAHRWFYYSFMDRHEALVFKQFDSQINMVTRLTPHAAFDLPRIPDEAPLRHSLEVRCLVLYT